MESRLLTLDLKHDTSGQSKHERLKEYLICEMTSGRLRPGQVLPSERKFAETLGVAHMTIRQAMSSLESNGLIRRVHGKGTFVADNVRQKLNCGQDIFALLVPGTREALYPSLLHGFEGAASKIRHQTIICSTNENVERQGDLILQLLDKKIGGVALNPAESPDTPAYQVRQLQEHGIPVVFCHRGVEGVMAPLLSIPFREAGRMAGETFVAQGHRRVGCFTGLRPCSAGQAFEMGLREALQANESGASVEFAYIETGSIKVREEACWRELQQMFAQPEPPTALFVTFDSMAKIINFLLPRLGLRVPEDVSLIGFGGTWREDVFMRRLTSVVVDEVAVGRQAVQLLHEMRRGDRDIDDSEKFVLELELSDGETVAKPAG